jgi:hypothetical protein
MSSPFSILEGVGLRGEVEGQRVSSRSGQAPERLQRHECQRARVAIQEFSGIDV